MMRLRYKTLTLCLLSLGLSSHVLAKPVLIKSQHQIEEYQLDNGFKVILAQNPKATQVYMNTVYFTGSLNDPQGKGGMAHLLEHLAFKGTTNIPGDEYQRRLDQYTLSTNASTSYYATKYYNTIRPEALALEKVIELEAERMDKLVLQEKYVPAEIDIVKREREIRMDQPFRMLVDQVFKSAYGNQSLGRLPIGDLPELQSINMQELEKFYKDWYMPNNAVMIISGKFDKAQVLKNIDKYFSPLKKGVVAQQAVVPKLDVNKLSQRQFKIEKGSDLAQVHLYLSPSKESHKTALSLSAPLLSLQPSGHLYQSMVTTGISTAVDAGPWLEQDVDLMLMIGIYSPMHDAAKVKAALIEGVEKNKDFDDTELKRAKSIAQNQAENVEKNAVALGNVLGDYVETYQGDWTRYFAHLNETQQLNVNEVNQSYRALLKAENRVEAQILPTPEDQKKAVEAQQASTETAATEVEEEVLKDPKVYRQEVKTYVKKSQQLIDANEKKISRGTLSNGMQYSLFPTETQDDKVYASVSVNFGTAEGLKHQAEVLDLVAYLLLRGSTDYSLQEITDQSISSQGSASVSRSDNGFNIHISAKKDKFDDYFDFILSVLKNPSFEQSEFDLIQKQTLASLDRPYTEPDTVATLTLTRLIERFSPGDLRYHFEPELAKKSYAAASRQQVLELYKKYMGMNHANLAVTGEFDRTKMQNRLSQQFATWSNTPAFERIITPYQALTAQKVHALAEQREFGLYVNVLNFPVGSNHPDVAALQVFRHILADSQLSSRLGMALREKGGLVYGFRGNLNFNDWNDAGALAISANYSAGKSAQVSQTVQAVLQNLISRGVTEQELEAAKADILKKRVNALEDERRIHSMLNPLQEQGDSLKKRKQRDQTIAKLKKADVDAVIKKYIKLDQLVEVMADQYGQPQPDYKIQ